MWYLQYVECIQQISEESVLLCFHIPILIYLVFKGFDKYIYESVKAWQYNSVVNECVTHMVKQPQY